LRLSALVVVACALTSRSARADTCSADQWDLCFDSKPGTMSSSITFDGIANAGAYNDDKDMKSIYEKGYGASLGLINTTTGRYLSGSFVESSASRRAATITFTATVHPDLTSAATTAHSTLTPGLLVQSISSVKTLMGSTVVVPEASQISGTPATPPPPATSAPTSAPTPPPLTAAATDDDTDSTGPIIIIVVVVVLIVGAAGGGYWYYQNMLAEEARVKAENAARAAEEVEKKRLEAELEAAELEKTANSEGLEVELETIDSGRMCCY